MPDRFGFDLLPANPGQSETARCIDCRAGGPIWEWPEPRRRQHARQHGRAPAPSAAERTRQRMILLAAALADTDEEEKEATTMATKTSKQAVSAKQVTLDVLRAADTPLHTQEIAQRVLASGRCSGLKGKTPEQTIAALLAVGSKPGGPFTRVDKGTYTLAAQTAAPTTANEPGKQQAKRQPKPTPRKQTAKV